MQDNCRATGQDSLGQQRETKEGLGETRLVPAVLSMEMMSCHVNLTWIPASAAQPCVRFPPWDALCSYQLAVSTVAQRKRMDSTPSCDTHQVADTALCHQCHITQQDEKHWRPLQCIRQRACTLQVQQIYNQLNNDLFGFQEPGARHVVSAASATVKLP